MFTKIIQNRWFTYLTHSHMFGHTWVHNDSQRHGCKKWPRKHTSKSETCFFTIGRKAQTPGDIPNSVGHGKPRHSCVLQEHAFASVPLDLCKGLMPTCKDVHPSKLTSSFNRIHTSVDNMSCHPCMLESLQAWLGLLSSGRIIIFRQPEIRWFGELFTT